MMVPFIIDLKMLVFFSCLRIFGHVILYSFWSVLGDAMLMIALRSCLTCAMFLSFISFRRFTSSRSTFQHAKVQPDTSLLPQNINPPNPSSQSHTQLLNPKQTPSNLPFLLPNYHNSKRYRTASPFRRGRSPAMEVHNVQYHPFPFYDS